jgi:Secretion system C-terminal sorting domain
VVTVDSLSSEGPSTLPTGNGFASNPWDATGGTGNTDKVECDPRIQLSRTPDGKYVIYTFAETDTAVTSNPTGNKWNQLPNVKARMMDVASQSVHTLEINVTRPPTSGPETYTNIISNSNVRSRAFFHYTSPKCALASTVVTNAGPAIYLPMTVTSNAGLQQLSPVVHRYISAVLDFGGVFKNSSGSVNGISENAIASATNSYIYPNPARGNTTLAIDLKNNANVEVTLTNMVGQVLKSTKKVAYTGSNNIDVDVNGLAKGIYMVNVKVDGANSTKKLIVE